MSDERRSGSRARAGQRIKWRWLPPLLAVLALALVFVAALVRRGLPQTRGSASLPALSAPVEVLRDGHGVAHVFASTDRDAVMAQGWIHAQDRLWQLEWQRRVSSGRLSELVGKETLDIDRFIRTLDVRGAAARALEQLPEESVDLLEAYAAGINAYLSTETPLPPEFAILRAPRPEPWSPIDSIAWQKMMAWNLGGNQQLELLRMRLSQTLGHERANELFPLPSTDVPLSIAPSTADGLLAIGDRLEGALRLGGYDVGSNAWVVSGEHTASGWPMLANDPHLGAQLPSQWHLIELKGDRLHVTGAALVGLPLILLGRNRHVAWGMTNLGPDVQDWVVEQLDPTDSTRYRGEDGWLPIIEREELIHVRGQTEPEHWAARATRHGPLLSDVTAEVPLGALGGEAPTALALRWTALDPDDSTITSVVALNHATDGADVVRAMRDWVAPPINLVWADSTGSIGYRAPGRIPIRAGRDGALPAAGWDVASTWTGVIPYDDLPALRDPERGWHVTANQAPPETEESHFLGRDFAPPYRAARIERALREATADGRRVDPEAMRSIQLDRGSDYSDALRPLLTAIDPDPADPRQSAALQFLVEWDGINRPEDVAPSILQAWQRQLLLALVDDELGSERGLDWRTAEGLNRRQSLFLLQLLSTSGMEETHSGTPLAPSATWCDDIHTPGMESCAQLAGVALTAALDELETLRGPRMSRWQWGDVHRTQLSHAPLSEVRVLRPIFHRELPAGGDAFSPNAGPVNWAEPYDHTHLPGYRQIITLRPMDIENRATNEASEADRFGIAGGQSGHPASQHYADLLQLHAEGEDIAMTMGKGAIQGRAHTLTLEP